jgi:imidazolonepropionase
LEKLIAETGERCKRMFAHGTTTAEAKTGYGLNTPDELKQMAAIAELQTRGPLDLVPTFLGAHAVPVEYRGRIDAYIALLIHEMLPAAWAKWEALKPLFPPDWPIFCDVFCEDGAFDLPESRRILQAAKGLEARFCAEAACR